ncbi:hypothetical protein JXQ70_15755 [bacterium]|nr:hypothetical protein [bacterium]
MVKDFVFLVVFLVLTLPEIAVAQTHSTPTPLVAVQLIDLSWKTEQDFTLLFSDLKAKGVNTVIIRLFQNGGTRDRNGRAQYDSGVYFKSDQAPLLTDLLEPACRAARTVGISLYGWMTTRNCDWYAYVQREWQDERYNLETKTKEFYPRCDIFHPAFRKKISDLFYDLAGYDLDGILLQDDCILRSNEAFSAHARQRYYRETGQDIDAQEFYRETVRIDGKTYVSKYSSRYYAWQDWKIDKLFEFITELALVCKKRRPALKIAMNFYYEILTVPAHARTWYAHDLERARNCPIDLFSFMVYHRQMAAELHKTPTQAIAMLSTMTTTALAEIKDPNRILMKLQVRDWDNGRYIEAQEIKTAFTTINQFPGVGIALVPYNRKVDLDTILSIQ